MIAYPEFLLITLLEELSEAQHVVGKALRIGLHGHREGEMFTSGFNIEKEFIEALAVRDLLREINVISEPFNAQFLYNTKIAAVKKSAIIARRLGTLEPET